MDSDDEEKPKFEEEKREKQGTTLSIDPKQKESANSFSKAI